MERGPLAQPALVFKPRDAAEVLAACEVAQRHSVPISARGSGHQYGGVALTAAAGGLLLDLGELSGVQVDPASRTARVGPAARARALRSAAAPHGLHFPLPHLSDVALGGYVLGGGNGWGVRQWGAAADNVLEMQAVLLGGGAGGGQGEQGQGSAGAGGGGGGCRLVRVTAQSDPELFWGLRGGAPFLAVVTELVLALHPLPGPHLPGPLPCFHATFPPECLEQVVAWYRGFLAAAPPCLEPTVAVVGAGGEGEAGEGQAAGGGRSPRPHGPCPSMVVLSCHAFAAPGCAEVEAAFAQLRAVLPERRLSLSEGPLPYEEALSVLDPYWHWPGLCMYGHGTFVPPEALLPPSAPAAATSPAAAAAGGPSSCVVAALAAAAAALTSPKSILLLCPGAPSKAPGLEAWAQWTDSTGGGGGGGGGGGVAWRPAAERGSLGFRDLIFCSLYSMWTRTEAGPCADGDEAHVAWVRTTAAALEPHVVGLYVNEVMHDSPEHLPRSYEPGDLGRLRALKARCDPRGLLRKL
ncbi:hypothetical protein HYH03_006005 [Edaphochlamys debaryana]|uniref:FAD-binding PCMH-type domain-containing protein n=1 Tax=Edaphochlamys debaryana TaxID=47281 RepID=A0A835Y7S3_9CHLO|nr:hypothetical protein HYH03_006005 [Edaphochlamys debaryana]|eukprot:KAG2495756.1 hypothetical protein HYH03_006005 [Edaphochlamys debaryana]